MTTIATTSDRERRELEIETEIRELSAHINAAQARIAELVAEFEQLAGVTPWGYNSPAHWLSVTSGTSMGEARKTVHVARRLNDLPVLAEAFRSGELSLVKAEAISAIATERTDVELVQLARDATPDQTVRLSRGYRRAVGMCRVDDRGEPVPPEDRYVRFSFTEGGMQRLSARLMPDEGAIVEKAIQAARQKLFDEDPAGFGGEGSSVDALVRVAETSLDHDAPAHSDLFRIMVHIDLPTLMGAEDGMCELDNGMRLDRNVLDRIGCDAAFISVLEDEKGNPLNVGRLTRQPPRRIRRAVEARDRCCVFPGCSRTVLVQLHHAKHWADGGETSAENHSKYCKIHHRRYHDGEFTVEGTPSTGLRFYTRSGREIRPSAEPARGPDLKERHAEQGLDIDAETSPRWCGDELDLGLATHLFMGRDEPEDWRSGWSDDAPRPPDPGPGSDPESEREPGSDPERDSGTGDEGMGPSP